MIKKIAFIGLSCILLIAASCNSGDSGAPKDDQSTITTGEVKNPQKPAWARYNFKSGIITYKATVMMMDQEIICYFDDWGIKQCNEVNINVLGKKAHNVTLTDSAWVYNWNPDVKTGTKVKVNGKDPNNINFTNLTDDIRKTFNITDEGSGKVLGRDCKVYSVSLGEAGIKGSYSIWNGIVLKIETSVKGLGINMEAIKIQENATIPAEKFTLPKDITFTETSPSASMEKDLD
jgi:outer membrane lipoprotein-sorting protein